MMECSGTTKGRKERLWGATGVMSVQGLRRTGQAGRFGPPLSALAGLPRGRMGARSGPPGSQPAAALSGSRRRCGMHASSAGAAHALGATMGPPADMLYAVEPEGVAMMMPSACGRGHSRHSGCGRRSGRSAFSRLGSGLSAAPQRRRHVLLL